MHAVTEQTLPTPADSTEAPTAICWAEVDMRFEPTSEPVAAFWSKVISAVAFWLRTGVIIAPDSYSRLTFSATEDNAPFSRAVSPSHARHPRRRCCARAPQ